MGYLTHANGNVNSLFKTQSSDSLVRKNHYWNYAKTLNEEALQLCHCNMACCNPRQKSGNYSAVWPEIHSSLYCPPPGRFLRCACDESPRDRHAQTQLEWGDTNNERKKGVSPKGLIRVNL